MAALKAIVSNCSPGCTPTSTYSVERQPGPLAASTLGHPSTVVAICRQTSKSSVALEHAANSVCQDGLQSAAEPSAGQAPDKIVVAVLHPFRAGVAKLADARDSKSRSAYAECGFDSLLRHQPSLVQLGEGCRARVAKAAIPMSNGYGWQASDPVSCQARQGCRAVAAPQGATSEGNPPESIRPTFFKWT